MPAMLNSWLCVVLQPEREEESSGAKNPVAVKLSNITANPTTATTSSIFASLSWQLTGLRKRQKVAFEPK